MSHHPPELFQDPIQRVCSIERGPGLGGFRSTEDDSLICRPKNSQCELSGETELWARLCVHVWLIWRFPFPPKLSSRTRETITLIRTEGPNVLLTLEKQTFIILCYYFSWIVHRPLLLFLCCLIISGHNKSLLSALSLIFKHWLLKIWCVLLLVKLIYWVLLACALWMKCNVFFIPLG